MSGTDWVRGDSLGLDIPAHGEALRAGGPAFLTQAFRAAGAIPLDNRVTAITAFREIAGGSTGRKLLLSVHYERPSPELHTELFVKFSRDFDDPLRVGGGGDSMLERGKLLSNFYLWVNGLMAPLMWLISR